MSDNKLDGFKLEEIKNFIKNDKKIMENCRNTISITTLTSILINKKIISKKEYQKVYEELLEDYINNVAKVTLESLKQESTKEVS